MTFHLIPALGISGDLLFFLVFAIFGLIKFLTSKKEKDVEPDVSDGEQAKRTREIQEEIRRRIAGNQTPARPAAQTRAERPVPQRREMPDIVVGPQIDYMEQLAEARRVEEESRRRARETLAAANLKKGGPAPSGGMGRDGVISMLNGANGLRDAYVINEILMPPVSERRSSSCPGMMQ